MTQRARGTRRLEGSTEIIARMLTSSVIGFILYRCLFRDPGSLTAPSLEIVRSVRDSVVQGIVAL